MCGYRTTLVEMVDKRGQYGQDLVDAVMARDSKLARKILRQGANTDYVVRGDTAIHLAARNGDKEIISALLRHGDSVNKGNQNGNTPLHYVARNGQEDIVKYLIDKGADINIQNEDGDSPLHASVGYQPMDVIENYVKLGMDVNNRNRNGDTPLHVAVDHSRDESVEALLLSKANADITNKQGKKAYQLAKREDIAEIIKTYSLLAAAMESGFIMAEGTKLKYRDVEQPKYFNRVGITMEKMSLEPNLLTVFYCRREKYENNSVNFQTEQEEEVVSDVYHFRVRDVIDELKTSFRIPVYAEPSEKQQLVLKFLAGVGGSKIISDYESIDQNCFCTVEAVLVPETTSVLVVCLCAKGQDEIIGEQAQHISSEVEDNFTLDIPEGAFQPDTVLSLKVVQEVEVYDVGDHENNTGDEDSKSLYSVAQHDGMNDDTNNTYCTYDTDNGVKRYASGIQKSNHSDKYRHDSAVLDCRNDEKEIITKDGKQNSKGKRKKRKRLMSDVFQILLTGDQPTKSITMQLPLTEEESNVSAEELQVIRVNDANYNDVEVIKTNINVEGTNVTFDTEHFSTFVMCPVKCTDLSKIVADIKTVKQRTQQARFFAMIRVLEDDVSHLLVIECIKSDISKKRRKHWKSKGFEKQKPKHTSKMMLSPSQKFTIELSGDAIFDTEHGETGQRKLVFSPHRASFQPYQVKVPIFYKDGKALVHIFSTETDNNSALDNIEESEMRSFEDQSLIEVAKLKIQLKLPPEEDPFGEELEDIITHETSMDVKKKSLQTAWRKMARFLLREEHEMWRRTQLGMHHMYLKDMERKNKESVISVKDIPKVDKKKTEDSRKPEQKLESEKADTQTVEQKLQSEKRKKNALRWLKSKLTK